MALAAIAYAGNISPSIKARGLEVFTGLQESKKVTLTHIWGKGAGGDHAKGLALDFMVFENAAAGHWIANYIMANAKRLGVQYMMWNHRIWNVDKDKYGVWRWVADRGSVTENHMDHVHVTFKSSSMKYVPPVSVTLPPSASKPNLKGLLVEDGKMGLKTRKGLQKMWGVKADGELGPNSRKAGQKWANVKQDGNWGPTSRKAIQRKASAKVTGIWNWDQSTKADPTTKALQAYHNRAVRAGTLKY